MSKDKPPQEVLDICKHPYARVIIPNEDAKEGEYGWSAFVLELPGCFSDGRTPEEAAKNIEEAMVAWVWASLDQGHIIPEPKLKDDYSGRFVVRMPRYLHRRTALHAAFEGVSMNQYVVSLLSEGVTKGEAQTSSCNRCGVRVRKGELLLGKLVAVKGNSGFHEALCQACYDKRQENLKEGRE